MHKCVKVMMVIRLDERNNKDCFTRIFVLYSGIKEQSAI